MVKSQLLYYCTKAVIFVVLSHFASLNIHFNTRNLTSGAKLPIPLYLAYYASDLLCIQGISQTECKAQTAED